MCFFVSDGETLDEAGVPHDFMGSEKEDLTYLLRSSDFILRSAHLDFG